MVERTRGLDIACHALLILGGLLVCVPIYFAFVVGSHTAARRAAGAAALAARRPLLRERRDGLAEGQSRPAVREFLVVAVGIAVGKIAVSLLSAFAIAYFRFRYRMLAFWLIFASLMLPVEVRILPTYEAVANVALPLQWLARPAPGIEVTLDWNMMNSYGGLILPLIASATATFLFRQFFLTVPEELCEAARIDGAGAAALLPQHPAAAVGAQHGGAGHHPVPLRLEPVSVAVALHHRQGHGDGGDRAEEPDPAVGFGAGLERRHERGAAGDAAAGAGGDGCCSAGW